MGRDASSSRPQGFADRAGGPAQQAGAEYQTLVATHQTLSFLSHARRHPHDPLLVRPELRLLVPGGQYGYDYGWSGGHEQDDECWEIKTNPSLEDVREFVRGLTFEDSISPATSVRRLVSGQRNGVVQLLDRLIARAKEAISDDHFAELIARGPRAATLAELAELATRSEICRAGEVLVLPIQTIEQRIREICDVLAPAGQREALAREVNAVMVDAAKSRRALVVAMEAERLQREGLLVPAPVVDRTDVSSEVLLALALLDVCPVALPTGYLAAALEVSEAQVSELMAESVTVGRAQNTEWGWVGSPGQLALLGLPGLDDVLDRALESLIEGAQRSPQWVASQTPNALALSQHLMRSRPRTVCEVFVAFDKPSKAWGHLSTVQDLARAAATSALLVAEMDRGEEIDGKIAALRARSDICGIGWVLQRVDELDEAEQVMKRAASLGEVSSDPKDLAFALKCRGRLLRMRAEELDVSDPNRLSLLNESAEMLRDAGRRFRSLMKSGNIGVSEDIGECEALLARTLATAFDPEAALEAAKEAHVHLDALPGSKAMADLTILEAELALRDQLARSEPAAIDAAGVEYLRAHVGRLSELRARHSGDRPPGSSARVPSEIYARALLSEGQILLTLGESEEARQAFHEAEVIYADLDYPVAGSRAAWEAARIRLDPLPQELLAAMDAAGADVFARMVTIQAYDDWRVPPAADMLRVVGADAEPSPEFWLGLVQRGISRARVTRPRWGDERRLG